MKYSPYYFLKIFPKEKKKTISFCDRFFYRPISFVFSWIFASLKIESNFVSFLNFILSIIICALPIFNNHVLVIVSSFLLIFWIVMDDVDGNLARGVKRNKYGDFMDSLSSYFLGAFYLPSLSLYYYFNGGIIFDKNNPYLLFISMVGSAAFTLLVLIEKKFNENSLDYGLQKKSTKQSILVRIGNKIVNEISFGGIIPILFATLSVFDFLDIAIIAYSVIFTLLFLLGLGMLLIKVVLANRNDTKETNDNE